MDHESVSGFNEKVIPDQGTYNGCKQYRQKIEHNCQEWNGKQQYKSHYFIINNIIERIADPRNDNDQNKTECYLLRTG